jgi:4-amino-4-deoxychorismate lyase
VFFRYDWGMKTIPQLTFVDVVEQLKKSPPPTRQGYLAMYSSWYGGIIRDPSLMMVPVDDHIVHRGDGVFEAIKCVNHKIYGLDRHLERLVRSAEQISLKFPCSLPDLKEIAVETTKVAGASDVILRLYLSRGPGGFTTNPYETLGSQIYLVITPLKPVAAEKYETGVTSKISAIAVKDGIFATVKSCNYLPNVLMKKESIDAGVDFTITIDEKGFLAEGSTENFAIISRDGEFLVPGFERTLKGITASRAMELAQPLVAKGLIKSVRNAQIKREDVLRAREAMMLGTTLDCLPVTRFENQEISGGKAGPVSRELLKLLRDDMKAGPLVTDLDGPYRP